jgi:hypothetical protein
MPDDRRLAKGIYKSYYIDICDTLRIKIPWSVHDWLDKHSGICRLELAAARPCLFRTKPRKGVSRGSRMSQWSSIISIDEDSAFRAPDLCTSSVY